MKKATIKKRKVESSHHVPMTKKATLYRSPRGINRELKVMTFGSLGGYTSSTTAVQGAVSIPEGVSQGNRIGRKVEVYSISVHATHTLALSAGLGTTADETRFSLILDRQPNKALPAVADFRTNTLPNAFPNPDNTKRFKVLVDQWTPLQLQLGGSGALGQAAQYVTRTFYVKKKFNICWSNTSADYLGITTNNIFIAYNSLQTYALSNCYLDITVQIKYYDD